MKNMLIAAGLLAAACSTIESAWRREGVLRRVHAMARSIDRTRDGELTGAASVDRARSRLPRYQCR